MSTLIALLRHRLAAPVALAAAAAALTAAFAVTRPPHRVILPDLGGAERVEDGDQHLPFGPVRPAVPLPDLSVLTDDGARTTLGAVIRDRWTIAQLMFTGCSTTCPLQGAIFQQTQQLLAGTEGAVGFLSISVDPLNDGPAQLRAWLDTYEAGPGWRAVAPRLDDVVPLVGVLHGIGKGVDVHDARVYLFDPQGRLVYATENLPRAEAVAGLVREAIAAPPAE